MTERAPGAPLLRPLITTKGLQAAVEASTLGKAVKIVKVGLTATPGEATPADSSLPGAQMLDVADGRLVNDHQVNVSALLPDTFPSMAISGIAFYLEDGTMFAVYREPEPFLEHTTGTTLLVGMDLVMDNIPSDSVIVESTGANLILGDWVPVERTVNGKGLIKDIILNASDVGALDTENGGTVKGPIFLSDQKKYISTAGTSLYVAAIEGKLILEGRTGLMARVGNTDHEIIHTGNLPKTDLSGYVPTTRKVNNKALSSDINLTAEDVGAVGKTGAQTMAGQLNGVKFTVTDAYALVSRLRPQHGVYLGNNANDKRTIIGGGGDVVGDASGAVHIRPNGITDMDGEVIIQPTGNIDAPEAPTADKHLANKGYVDKVKSAIETLLKDYLPLAGGILKGALTGAIMKGAIKLNDKASVSFQDAAGTVFHAFANANALRLSHGNNGENRIMDIGPAAIDSAVPVYANTGLIARTTDSSKWLSLEVPATGSPYIASRTSGESAAIKVMTFDADGIKFSKTPMTPALYVTANAGLRFVADGDFAGTSWGLGIDPANRQIGLHRYTNGTWSALSFWIDAAGVVGMNSLNVKGGAEAQYLQVRNTANPTVELHEPGVAAAMMYKPKGVNTIRFSQSNGAGGESTGYAEINANGVISLGKFIGNWNNNRSWSSFGHSQVKCSDADVYSGALFGGIAQRFRLPNVYNIEMFYGWQTSGSASESAHIFAATDGASYTQAWSLRNGGQLASPSGWYINPNGDLWSPRLGSTVVDWAAGNLANINHTHSAMHGNRDVVNGAFNAIGSYMFATVHPGNVNHFQPGFRCPGSWLYPCSAGDYTEDRGYVLPGTWQAQGLSAAGNQDDRWDDRATLWIRVA